MHELWVLTILGLPLLVMIGTFLFFLSRWGRELKTTDFALPFEYEKYEMNLIYYIVAVLFFESTTIVFSVIDSDVTSAEWVAIILVPLFLGGYCWVVKNHFSVLNIYLGEYVNIFAWLNGPYEKRDKTKYKFLISKWMKNLEAYDELYNILFEKTNNYDEFVEESHKSKTYKKNRKGSYWKYYRQFFEKVKKKGKTEPLMYKHIRKSNQRKIKKRKTKQEFPNVTAKHLYEDLRSYPDREIFSERILYWFIVKLVHRDYVMMRFIYNPLFHVGLTLLFGGIFAGLTCSYLSISVLVPLAVSFGIGMTICAIIIICAVSIFSQKGGGIEIQNIAAPKTDKFIVSLKRWAFLNSIIGGITLLLMSVEFFLATDSVQLTIYASLISSLTIISLFLYHNYSAMKIFANAKERKLMELEEKIKKLEDEGNCDTEMLILQSNYKHLININDWPINMSSIVNILLFSLIPQIINLLFSFGILSIEMFNH